MLVKKTVSFALRFGLVSASLIYAFWGVNFSQLWQALSSYALGPILLTCAFSFLSYGAMALRFNFLTGHTAGFWLCLKAFFLGMAVNNVIPAKLGELAKAFYLRRAGGFSLSKGVTMVFWERFFDLNALLAMGLAVALHFRLNLAFVPLAAVVGGIWAALFVVRTFPNLVERIIDLMPSARLSAFLADIKLQILHGVTPGFMVVLGLYTVLCWALYAGVTYLFLLWAGQFSLTVGQATAVFVLSALGMAMPSSPGGGGVFEAAVVFALGLFGVDKEQALAAGVVLHMLQYIPVTLLGVLILAKSGLNIKKIRESEEGLDEESGA
jgi:uncharacterized protein (TIRG00374 family)